MKAQRRTDRDVLVCTGGANGRDVRYEIGVDGRVTQATPLVGAKKNENGVVTPGLVDIQVNGFAGVDFNAPGVTAERLDVALSAMLSSGVTRCLPTLITASEAELIGLLQALDAAVSASVLGALMVPGYHIEGPFLSPQDGYAGAHPADRMRSASRELVQRLEAVTTRPLLMMTVAPEVPGVLDLIPFLIARGISCAIGHTAASRDAIDQAIEAGASVSTHLGNGLPHMLNKNGNSFLFQLGRDQLMASFIADGVHIASDVLQSWLRAKTIDRSILVTDASAAAGAPEDTREFTLGAGAIERHADGSVRLPGSNYLAGSAASMDKMVRNVMRWYGLTIGEVLQLARENPARAAGLPVAEIGANDAADFVEWGSRDGELYVRRTHIGPWILRSEGENAAMKSA